MTAATMSGALKRSTRIDWRRAWMWLLQTTTAGAFAATGVAKLWGTTDANSLFDTIDQAIGIGPWLRYVLGLVEVLGAVAILDVDAAGFAAVALSFVTFGAVATHILVLHTNPVLPVALFVALLLIAWARRGELLAVIHRPVAAPALGDRPSKQV
jgi:putative oxidoreductase